MMCPSDTTFAVNTIVFLLTLILSTVAGVALASQNTHPMCNIEVYKSKAESHVWVRPCWKEN